MGIQCQITSVKFKFSNICELKPYGTMKKTLLIKFEECNCVESVQLIILFPIHLSIKHNKTQSKFMEKFTVKCMENKKKIIVRFLTQLHPSNAVSKIFFLVS